MGTEAPLVLLPARIGTIGRELIQKVYEVDPLACPKCQGEMKIISLCEVIDYVK